MSSFKETVKQIRNSERNVDKVLKAARLDRVEKPRMDGDYIFALIILLTTMIFMGLMFSMIGR